jgi:NADPH-dependent glutamate synthase beta subunit-like oxidoreductase
MPAAGGCLAYAIPEYRLPRTVIDDLVGALKGMGVKFELGVAVGTDPSPADLEARHDRTFYATGAWKRPVLGFDGEELTEFG